MKRKLLVMFFILAMLSSASSISPYYAEEEAPTPAINGKTGTPTAPLETPMPTPTPSDMPAPMLMLTGESEGDLFSENNSDAAFSGRDYFYLSHWPADVIYGGQKVVFTCSGMPRKGWQLIGIAGGVQCYEKEITQKGSFSISIDVSKELSKAAGKVIRFYAYDLDEMGQQNGASEFLCASLLTTEISVSAPEEIYTGEVFEGRATPYAFVTVSIPGSTTVRCRPAPTARMPPNAQRTRSRAKSS